MPRLLTLCIAGLVALIAPACSSDDNDRGGVPDEDNTIVPDSTTPAPGSCDPLDQQIPAPSVVVDGDKTDATFGIGAYQCSTLTGEGYIINNYNPVLIDADEPVTVRVEINSAATAKLAWGLGGEFTRTGDREWTASAPLDGCDRLTITLKSPTGQSRATYGADIRVGGEATPCPQRDVDPTDVGAIETIPPDLSVAFPVVSHDIPIPSDSGPDTGADSGGTTATTDTIDD